jgi:two-component system, NtrC family, sensor histidine kinase HydH
MSIQSLSALLAAIVTFVIGWSVVLRDRRHRQYVTFAVLCFNLCFWYLASFFSTALQNGSLYWFSLIFALAIPSTAQRFFRAFLADDPRQRPSTSRLTVIATWIFYLLLLYAGLFYPLHQSRWFTAPLFVFIIGSLYHCVYLIYARQKATRSRPESARLTYLLYGGAATVTLAATDFVLPRAGLAFPTIGNVLTVIYMYFISQTLFRYRLLDVKELLGKMVTLSALVLSLTIIYGLLLAWVGRDRPGVFFFNTVIASFVILVLFEPLRTWVEDRINRWMFREKYEFSRRLRLLRYELANIIEVPTLVARILRHLEESERVTHASIFLADPTGATHRLAGHVGPVPIDQIEGTTRHLFLERLREAGILNQEGLERELEAQKAEGLDDAAVATRNVLSTLEELRAGVCIPLSSENQLLGLLNLRDDRLREAYASDELDDLRKVAAQAAITLRNSKVYEQMKERDRLAALGQMAAGLAHEIRNPLGAIKGAAQLLKTEPALGAGAPSVEGPPVEGPPEGLPTEGPPAADGPATADEYLGIIVEEVNRLDRVVSQFLGYARPDRGDRQELSINDVVLKTLPLLTPQIGEVKLETDLASDLPPVRADPEQLRQVFLNLGLNALQAMEGKGVLRVATRPRSGIKRGDPSTFVEVSFEDSGKGIPPESLSDIFIPFFTTKQGGTGLGLPICQRIIENHRGSIEVRSQVGRGSVFAVLLPLADSVTGTHPM